MYDPKETLLYKAYKQEVDCTNEGCELELSEEQVHEVVTKLIDCDWLSQQMNERISELVEEMKR